MMLLCFIVRLEFVVCVLGGNQNRFKEGFQWRIECFRSCLRFTYDGGWCDGMVWCGWSTYGGWCELDLREWVL